MTTNRAMTAALGAGGAVAVLLLGGCGTAVPCDELFDRIEAVADDPPETTRELVEQLRPVGEQYEDRGCAQ